jgi:hypothetical protein
MKLVDSVQRHIGKRETSGITWRTQVVRADNRRIYTDLLGASRSKKEVQGALDKLKGNCRTAEDGKLQTVVEKAELLVDRLESVAPHYGLKLPDDDWRVPNNNEVVGVLLRLGGAATIGQRTESALENLRQLGESIRNAESLPGKVKLWLALVTGKTEDIEVSDELIELRMSVAKAEESLQKLAQAVGVDKDRRGEVVK